MKNHTVSGSFFLNFLSNLVLLSGVKGKPNQAVSPGSLLSRDFHTPLPRHNAPYPTLGPLLVPEIPRDHVAMAVGNRLARCSTDIHTDIVTIGVEIFDDNFFAQSR